MNREQSDRYYMEVAKITAKQSYAIKRKVGAIIVKDNRIISEGFNGTPSGFENVCEDVKCTLYPDQHICAEGKYRFTNALNPNYCKFAKCKYLKLTTYPKVLHAESNAITKCAKYGNPTMGSTLYVTCSPCIECSKLIIQAGIKRVVYLDLHDEDGIKLLKEANIEVNHYEG